DAVRIVDRGLDADVARVGGDLRFDGGDLAFELAARIGIDGDADGLPDLERAAVLFRHGEVGVELRQIGQGDDLGSRRQVLTDFDLANAEFAVERRLRLIDGRLRPELTAGQLLGAVERELRHGRLRLEAGKVGLLRTIEQL